MVCVTVCVAEAGQGVPLQVNKLWSAKTQLTYSYYSLPFCKPDNVVEEKENLGQVRNSQHQTDGCIS